MDEQANTELRKLVANEINLGFTYMDTVTLSRHAGQAAYSEQALHDARTACETAMEFLSQLPSKEAAEFRPRLDALRSILFQSAGTGLTSSAHG